MNKSSGSPCGFSRHAAKAECDDYWSPRRQWTQHRASVSTTQPAFQLDTHCVRSPGTRTINEIFNVWSEETLFHQSPRASVNQCISAERDSLSSLRTVTGLKPKQHQTQHTQLCLGPSKMENSNESRSSCNVLCLSNTVTPDVALKVHCIVQHFLVVLYILLVWCVQGGNVSSVNTSSTRPFLWKKSDLCR